MLQNVVEVLQEMQGGEIEQETGKSVITRKNSENPELLDE